MRIIFSFIFSFVLLINTAFAFDPIPNANNFLAAGNRTTNGINTSDMVNKVDGALDEGLTLILSVLYRIGLIIGACVLAFMAIQILTASPQQKAQLKAGVAPYLVGLLLFVAGVPVAIFIIHIFTQLF